jgi:cytochrome c peroxidase
MPNRQKNWIARIALVLLLAGLSAPALSQAQAQPLPPVPVPAENPVTEAKRVLGKILFWEEQLSSDNTMACGTCHIPASGGGDPRIGIHPGSDGLSGTQDDVIGSPGMILQDESGTPLEDAVFGFSKQVTGRAAQSYFMNMFAEDLFWDGRASGTFRDPVSGAIVIASGGGLESQALGPILSSAEMAHQDRDWDHVTTKLGTAVPLRLASNRPADVQAAIDATPSYGALFAAAFGDDAITATRIAMAIATYERTLVPDQSPWDRFVAGQPGAMTNNQIQGWNAFNNGPLPCRNCHIPPMFTDNQFYNIGLRPASEDEGRRAVTGNAADFGDMKTPSLRNTGLRATLMHTGGITDVPDALDFYTEAGGHNHFTADQSTIPNGGGAYDDIRIPRNVRGPLADFIGNALTDPRVAAEQAPFDRPTLNSEGGESVVRCSDSPQLSCRRPATEGSSRLRITDSANNSSDRIQWRWNKGTALDIADFGDPTDDTGYAFCLYNEGADQPLLFEARAPGGEGFGDSNHWSTSGPTSSPRAFKYSDNTTFPDGIKKVSLKPGTTGKSRIQVKAQGENLAVSPLGLPTGVQSLPLVAQLQAQNGECWEVRYTTASRNDGERFDAK